MSDDPNTYVFSKPILVIDKMVDRVTLREPTGEDLVKAGDPDNNVAYMQRLAEILANLPIGTLKSVRARDVIALGRLAAGFLAAEARENALSDISNAPAGGVIPGGHSG